MPGTMLICTPLRCEWVAVRTAVSAREVRRTGYGRRESVRAAASCAGSDFSGVAVAGLAGGVSEEVISGDLVVASEVWDTDGRVVPCSAAPLMTTQLRRAGLRTWCGPLASTGGITSGAGRAELAERGALAADLESAPLAMAASQRPLVIVRAVVDTPQRPLARPGTVTRALRALVRLHRAAAQLPSWERACAPRRVVACHDAQELERSGADLVIAFDGAKWAPAHARRVTHVEDVRLAWLAQARTIAVMPSASGGAAELDAVVRVLRGLGPVADTSSGADVAATGSPESARCALFRQDEAIGSAKEVH